MDCLEGGLMAELGLEAARTKARYQGSPASVSRDSGPLGGDCLLSGPRVKPRRRAQPPDAAGQSGRGTFAVHFREQLAQRPLHLPGAADEGRHHLEQLVLVLLPDHGDGLQDELHLLQLMSPWGGKRQMVTPAAHAAGGCGNPSA